MKKDQELVDYFISETNKKFDFIMVEIAKLREEDIKQIQFKAETLARMSLVSAIVSLCIAGAFQIGMIIWGRN